MIEMNELGRLNDRDLERVLDTVARERQLRIARGHLANAAQDCAKSPHPGRDAMKLADPAECSMCETAGSPPPTPRSFAPPRSIGWAIKQLQNGARVTRRGWNGPRQWLALQVPDGGSFMTLPYVYIRTVQGDRVPWLASQTDLLACDWQLAP